MVYSAIYINSYWNRYPVVSTSPTTNSNIMNKPILENMLMIDYSFYL
jgi:hypothetical protein